LDGDTGFWLGNVNGGDHLEDRRVHWRIKYIKGRIFSRAVLDRIFFLLCILLFTHNGMEHIKLEDNFETDLNFYFYFFAEDRDIRRVVTDVLLNVRAQ
jgi:hypothetical protein